jgi:hypothetical protein
MIHTRYLIVASLIVGGACSDLPSFDDPRDYQAVPADASMPPRGDASRDASTPGGDGGLPGSDGSISETEGTCDGSYVSCTYRALSQCNSGCEITTLCHGEGVEYCAVIRDPDACDGDMACRWSSGVCRSQTFEACSLNESQTACNNETSYECSWGSSCTGFPDSCFEAKTRSTCIVNLGCTWTPS